MASLQQILDDAVQQASGVNQDGHTSPVVDGGEYTAYTLFFLAVPHILRKLLSEARDESEIQDLCAEHTIAFTAGVANLPESILKSNGATDYWQYPDRAFVSVIPFADFMRFKFTAQMDYLAILGQTLRYYRQGTGAGYTGNLTVYAPTVPDLPSDVASDVELHPRIVERVTGCIASVLRGETPIAALKE